MPTPRSRQLWSPVLRRTWWAAILLCGCPGGTQFPVWQNANLEFNRADAPTPALADGEPLFDSQPVFVSIPGRIGSHAPTLTAFANGELLAAWCSYEGPGELDGAAVYTARRLAGDDTWGPADLHVDTPTAHGNPVLYSEADQVWLFQAVVPGIGWSTAHIEVQTSVDRGRSWSQPQVIPGPLGSNVHFPPVRTNDGTLLLPAYDDLLQRSLFFSSSDGRRWGLRSTVATAPPNQNLQPSAVQLDDGRLLAVLRNGGRGWLWVTASDDGGRTWTRPADSGFPNPGSPAALLRLVSGNLVLIYNDSNTARRPLSIAISADQGVTWHAPRVLVDGSGSYAYPSAIQTPDGLIHVLYSHNRERIEHLTLNEAWIVAGAADG